MMHIANIQLLCHEVWLGVLKNDVVQPSIADVVGKFKIMIVITELQPGFPAQFTTFVQHFQEILQTGFIIP